MENHDYSSGLNRHELRRRLGFGELDLIPTPEMPERWWDDPRLGYDLDEWSAGDPLCLGCLVEFEQVPALLITGRTARERLPIVGLCWRCCEAGSPEAVMDRIVAGFRRAGPAIKSVRRASKLAAEVDRSIRFTERYGDSADRDALSAAKKLVDERTETINLFDGILFEPSKDVKIRDSTRQVLRFLLRFSIRKRYDARQAIIDLADRVREKVAAGVIAQRVADVAGLAALLEAADCRRLAEALRGAAGVEPPARRDLQPDEAA
jgi:hypothetical protein